MGPSPGLTTSQDCGQPCGVRRAFGQTTNTRGIPFQNRPPRPMSRHATQAHGQGLPKITPGLQRWQMLLLLPLTGLPSLLASTLFPVNSQGSLPCESAGRPGSCLYTDSPPRWAPREDWTSPLWNTGALWGFAAPRRGLLGGFILKVNQSHPPPLPSYPPVTDCLVMSCWTVI